MTNVPHIRIDAARDRARALENAIARSRDEYAGADPQALAAYLDSMVRELLEVRAAIDEALGIASARTDAASVWLRFQGGRVGQGRAPMQVIGRSLEALQRGVRQMAAYMYAGHAFLYRIPREIERRASLDVLALAPGSARIGIAPSLTELELGRPLPLAEEAFLHLISVAAWAEQEGSDDALDPLLPDRALRRQLLSRIREFTPSSSGDFEALEVSGLLLAAVTREHVARFTRRAPAHASEYLKRRQVEPVVYRGRLVAIDIEKGVFDLRFGRRRIHCFFTEEALAEAKRLIESFVEVTGIGHFHKDSEAPHRIDVRGLRQLTPDERAML